MMARSQTVIIGAGCGLVGLFCIQSPLFASPQAQVEVMVSVQGTLQAAGGADYGGHRFMRSHHTAKVVRFASPVLASMIDVYALIVPSPRWSS